MVLSFLLVSRTYSLEILVTQYFIFHKIDLRFCISNEFSGDTDAAAPGTPLKTQALLQQAKDSVSSSPEPTLIWGGTRNSGSR